MVRIGDEARRGRGRAALSRVASARVIMTEDGVADSAGDFARRFGEDVPDQLRESKLPQACRRIVSRGCVRRYRAEPVSDDLLTALLACAQSAPTKSNLQQYSICLLYTSPSPRDRTRSRMPSSA